MCAAQQPKHGKQSQCTKGIAGSLHISSGIHVVCAVMKCCTWGAPTERSTLNVSFLLTPGSTGTYKLLGTKHQNRHL